MTVFAVLSPRADPRLAAQIASQYPDHKEYGSNVWLLQSKDTALEVSHRLGVSVRNAEGTATSQFGHVMVIQLASSYWGFGPTDVWDWLKSAFERTA